VVDEIHAPVLIPPGGRRHRAAVQTQPLLPPGPHAHLQPFKANRRWTRFLLPRQPSRLSKIQMRAWPNRGRTWARARMRIRNAEVSRARDR
jgi:hypothetical protein